MEGGDVHAQLDSIMGQINVENEEREHGALHLIAFFKKQGLSTAASEALNATFTLIGRNFEEGYETEAGPYLELLRRLDKSYVSSTSSGIACQKWSEGPFTFFHNMNSQGSATKSSHFSVVSNPSNEDSGCTQVYVGGDGDFDDVIYLNPKLFLPLVRQMNFLAKAETSTLRVYTDFSNAAGTQMPHGIILCPIITTPFSKVRVINFKDVFLCGTTMEIICASDASEVSIDAHALEPITVQNLNRCTRLTLRLVSIGDGQNTLMLSKGNLDRLQYLCLDTAWKFYNESAMPIGGSIAKWNIVDLKSRDLEKIELVFNLEDGHHVFGFNGKKSVLEIDPMLEKLPFRTISLRGYPMEIGNDLYWPSQSHVFYSKKGCVAREHENGEKLTQKAIAYPDGDDLNIFMWSRQFTRENIFSVQTRVDFARILKGRDVECLTMNDTLGIAIGAVRPFLEMTDQTQEDATRFKMIDSYDDYLFDSVPTMRCLVLQHTIHTSMHTMPFPKKGYLYNAYPGLVMKTDRYLETKSTGGKRAMHVEWDAMVPEVDAQRTRFEGVSIIIAADGQVRVPEFCTQIPSEKKWMKEREFLHKNYQKKFESAKGLCGGWI